MKGQWQSQQKVMFLAETSALNYIGNWLISFKWMADV